MLDRAIHAAAWLFVAAGRAWRPVLETAGYAALSYGAWLAWEPLGWVVGGLCALNMTLGSRRAG